MPVDLPVGRDPGPIRGRRPAVAEVAPDRILRHLLPLFRHDRVPDRRRDRDFVQGLCRPVDPVLVPAVHSRLPAETTRHLVPPSRRVRHEVEVPDRRKDRRGRPVGSRRRPCRAIPVRLVIDCLVGRVASHRHRLASCAIRPDRRDQVMVTVGRWPFVSAICRCARPTPASKTACSTSTKSTAKW